MPLIVPAAGGLPTAAQLADLIPSYVRKAVDETVNNSNTLQNDDELFLPVAANATYTLEMLLHFSSGTTPDLKFAWTYPTGTTMVWTQFGQVTTFQAQYFIETQLGALDGTGVNISALIKGTVNTGANAGTLQFQWAQITATASATIVRAGTYLELRRRS